MPNYCSLISKTHQSAYWTSSVNLHSIFIGALPLIKEYYVEQWKNYFSEMKGDKGISRHQKEGEQEDAHTETKNH